MLLGIGFRLGGNRGRDDIGGVLHAPLLLQKAEIKITWSAECRLVNIAHSWFLLQFNFNDSCLSERRPLAQTGSWPVEFDASLSFGVTVYGKQDKPVGYRTVIR